MLRFMHYPEIYEYIYCSLIFLPWFVPFLKTIHKEPNDLVVSGASCNHFFHTSCVLDWLDKHDHCPYCRQEMITTDQMKAAATKILGAERVAKLMAHTIRQSSADYGAASGGAWDFDM